MGRGCVQITARSLAFVLCELEGFARTESDGTALAAVWRETKRGARRTS